jgi:DNA-binding CsgD family transcriptional regulator
VENDERDPRFDESKREEAARLYRSGLSERQVGERMGVSKSRARSYLNDAGVRRRRRGRPRAKRRRQRA